MRLAILISTLTLAIPGSLLTQVTRQEYAARRDSLVATVQDGAIRTSSISPACASPTPDS